MKEKIILIVFLLSIVSYSWYGLMGEKYNIERCSERILEYDEAEKMVKNFSYEKKYLLKETYIIEVERDFIPLTYKSMDTIRTNKTIK